MNKKAIIILILSALTIYTYAQEKKEYWDNGNLKSITNYSDGEKDGLWYAYYEDGGQKERGRYDSGKKGGAWREYYFNGETKRVRQFDEGILSGFMAYHFNGRMMVTGVYDEDEKKHGNWQQFYENGWSKLKGDYSHGEKQGEWKFYKENGNIYKIENYNVGVKTSKWEMSDDDKIKTGKNIKNTYSYTDNRLNGEWKFYNEKGKCIEIGNYLNDKKDGQWTYYYDNGQLKKVELMDEGKLIEIISYSDINGNALDQGTLKEGNGSVKEYNSEGVATTVNYVNGEVIDWDNYSTLNSLAWNVYENESDKEKLANAVKWVKRSIELNKNYYNSDTYAALLYKMGNYKEALVIAQEAITIAKKDNEDFSATTKLIEEINSKLKKPIKK